jgi:hypothetical protein
MTTQFGNNNNVRRGLSYVQLQWQPGTLTATKDPNPLINLEGAIADDRPGGTCMSSDVDVWGLEAEINYQDDIQGTQCEPLHDFEAAPDESVLNTSIPDYIVDEMFEPGEFWFQTGPPTSLDDDIGQSRGYPLIPDYLEPDGEIDPSDADWQNPTTQNDATCTSPYVATSDVSTNSATTSHTFPIPVGNVGDTIIVFGSYASGVAAANVYPAGWEVVHQRAIATSNNFFWILRRVLDGSESATGTVTSAATESSAFVSYLVKSADPFTGPPFAILDGSPNPPNITIPWADPSLVLAVDEADGVDSAPGATFPTNMPQARRWVAGSGLQIYAAAAQTTASSYDPDAWGTTAGTDGATTLALKGFCLDNLNSDPAAQSIPAELEPEAELLQDGWQHGFAAIADFVAATDDDITGTSVPSELEPEAEPNPDDITFGWQRQSFGEDDYQPGTQWAAVTEPQEDVYDDTQVWAQSPLQDLEGDSDPASHYFPDDLEPEAEVDSDGWQGGVTIADVPLEDSIFRAIAPDYLEPDTEHDEAYLGWQIQVAAVDDGEICYLPVVESVATYSSGASPSSTHNVTLPSSISSGDKLIMFVATESGTSVTTPAGWTKLTTGTAAKGQVLVRSADGTEGATQTVTLGSSDEFAAITYRVTTLYAGATWYAFAEDNTTGNPPPPLTHGFPVNEVVWLVAANKHQDVDQKTAAPSGFTNLQDVITSTGGFRIATAQRVAIEASQTPGSWTPNDNGLNSFTMAVRGECVTPSLDPAARCIPDDLEPDAESDTFGWQASPLHDTPSTGDITGASVPTDLEPEDGVDTYGWFSAPLEEIIVNGDICGTSQLILSLDNETDGFEGFICGPLDDAPFVPPPPDAGVSIGTLPGVMGRKKWWLEREVSREKQKRARGEGRWPNLPEPKTAPPWKPKVVQRQSVRPRLDAINRDWKIKLRKARQQDDAIIMAIILALLQEKNNDPD